MKKITRLIIQKKNKKRVNVYLDNEFAFGLALAEAISLKVGQVLDDKQIAILLDKDAYQKALASALDYLTRRPRSRQEIKQYLLKKEISPYNLQAVLTYLTDLNLLDDLAFAQYWIENREAFRPRGDYGLRYELRRKGVSETIIEEALLEADIDQVESAYRVAQKNKRRWARVENQWELQKKVGGYLSRRGFGWDVIREVSQRLWDARDDTE